MISEKDTHAYHLMAELCLGILNQDKKSPLDSGQPPTKQNQQQRIHINRPMANVCRYEILKQCGVDVLLLLKENAVMTKEYKQTINQLRSFNTSHCLKISFGVDVAEIGLPKMTKEPFTFPSENFLSVDIDPTSHNN